MALSGSISTNGASGEGEGRYYTLSWTATQSIANNTSTISWTLSTAGGYSSWITERTVYVDIDGERVFSKTNAVDRYRGTIATGTKTISHNSDGTRSFSVSLAAAIYYSSIGCTGSQTFTLDTIARASTLSVSDGTLGTKTTLTADRKSSSFTHTLTWECGNYSGTLATKSSATSWPFTPELKLASVAPYGQKVYCTYTLSTYNGSTLVGTDSKSAWFAIPSSVKPSCTLSLSDSKGYASTYGGYIQGESQLSVTINATQAYGSPISRYSASANGATYSTQTFTTSVLTTVGTNTISATVIDGRERPGSVSSNITVLAYSRPQITNLKVRRCNANGTENDRGGYGKISFHCTITPLSNKNTRACSIKYRQSGATTWTNAPAITLSAYDQDCNPPVIQMSDAHSYEVQINLTDKFGTTSAVTSISTGYCLYHIPASGKGITFGGIAEGDGFNVKMNATFGEKINVKKDATFSEKIDAKKAIYMNGADTFHKDSSGKLQVVPSTHFAGGITEDIPVVNVDCNEMITSGTYYLGGDATNRPIAMNGWLTVKTYALDVGYCFQEFITYTGLRYRRMRDNGTWGSWIQEADFVVAQGGVPSSSNTWTYRKWNSGLAECWIRLYVDQPYNHPGWNEYWAYLPFAFADTNYLIQMTSAWNTSTIDYYGAEGSNGGWNKTTEKFLFGFYYNPSGAYNVRFDVYVTGSWK